MTYSRIVVTLDNASDYRTNWLSDYRDNGLSASGRTEGYGFDIAH